ncbi:hypothetical protein NRIC_09830 [Enterococcus florum]|uniref:Uncharacterized protein n=1 Tax=Enterococcus florum TaxID=2480627 RepID=A0A4P5PCD6_9ENTE|nr:hypothetical protein NRIC_09830 [Enterococcus florum]
MDQRTVDNQNATVAEDNRPKVKEFSDSSPQKTDKEMAGLRGQIEKIKPEKSAEQ